MPLHEFEGNDGRSEHSEGYLYLIVDQGSTSVQFHTSKDYQFRGQMVNDVQPFRRGDYVVVIVSYDENRVDWEEEDEAWTNKWFHIYPSLQAAREDLASHHESEHTYGVDIYDFDSAVNGDIWWY